MISARAFRRLVASGTAVVALAACGSAVRGQPSAVGSLSSASPAGTTAATGMSAAPSTSTAPTPPRRTTARPTPVPTTGHATAVPMPAPSRSTGNRHPVIVIDPGHSVTIHATDPATGLDVSDYENEPEMRDVFHVAELVRGRLVAAGYRVIMTKPTVSTPTTLGQRAAVADAAHAALALSIHDQAGASGGVGFDQGNNTVYYQSVGDWRATPSGRKVFFSDSSVAARSAAYGRIFQRTRAAAQGTRVSLLGNTGYDLGSRGLPGGDIWLVQLLAHVPWIYNEAGGNSPGMVGLSSADEQRYADGIVAAVRACVPVGG